MAQENFKVSPQRLCAQPGTAPKCHQSPEKSRFCVCTLDVGEKGAGSEEQKNALNQVAECGKQKAAWHQKRQKDMDAHHQANDGGPLPYELERSIPHASIVCFSRCGF